MDKPMSAAPSDTETETRELLASSVPMRSPEVRTGDESGGVDTSEGCDFTRAVSFVGTETEGTGSRCGDERGSCEATRSGTVFSLAKGPT
jgi:hypothetical protein